MAARHEAERDGGHVASVVDRLIPDHCDGFVRTAVRRLLRDKRIDDTVGEAERVAIALAEAVADGRFVYDPVRGIALAAIPSEDTPTFRAMYDEVVDEFERARADGTLDEPDNPGELARSVAAEAAELAAHVRNGGPRAGEGCKGGDPSRPRRRSQHTRRDVAEVLLDYKGGVLDSSIPDRYGLVRPRVQAPPSQVAITSRFVDFGVEPGVGELVADDELQVAAHADVRRVVDATETPRWSAHPDPSPKTVSNLGRRRPAASKRAIASATAPVVAARAAHADCGLGTGAAAGSSPTTPDPRVTVIQRLDQTIASTHGQGRRARSDASPFANPSKPDEIGRRPAG